MPRCKACNAQIDFVTMTSGKAMPVESLEEETYYLHLNQHGAPQRAIVVGAGGHGVVIRGREGHPSESGIAKVEGRESHFAHCPGARTFRKP